MSELLSYAKARCETFPFSLTPLPCAPGKWVQLGAKPNLPLRKLTKSAITPMFGDGEASATIRADKIHSAKQGRDLSVDLLSRRDLAAISLDYRKAVRASRYGTIYAHMRKSNVASRRTAEEAGFSDVTTSWDKTEGDGLATPLGMTGFLISLA